MIYCYLSDVLLNSNSHFLVRVDSFFSLDFQLRIYTNAM